MTRDDEVREGESGPGNPGDVGDWVDGGHLTAEALADLDEGLLAEDRAASAQRHVDGCDRCRGTSADLTSIRATLRAGSDPGPMPADVVARIEAALMPGRAGPAATVTPFGPRAGNAQPPQHRRRWPVRALQVAAVLLVGSGTALAFQLPFGGSGNDASVTADSAAPEGGQESADATARGSDPVPLTASGRDYTAAELPEAARELLSGASPYDREAADSALEAAPAPTGAQAPPEIAADARPDRDRVEPATAAADSCARSLDQPVRPLAIDVARYQGQPAWLVIFPDGEGAGGLSVYVTDVGCPPGTFRYFVNVPRG